jgi:hypothetical protein
MGKCSTESLLRIQMFRPTDDPNEDISAKDSKLP